MLVSFNSNTTGVTSGAGTANLSRAPEFTPSFQWGTCARSLFVCVIIYCRSLFVLRFTNYDLVSSNSSSYGSIVDCALWSWPSWITNKHKNKKRSSTCTPLKTGDELRCSGKISSSCSTSDTSRVTVKRHEHYLTWTSCN
jgi:hypothetical protein